MPYPDLAAFLRSRLPAGGTLNLVAWERGLCVAALTQAGNIIEAARLLGCTQHALKRRIIKHGIRWSRSSRAALPESAAPS